MYLLNGSSSRLDLGRIEIIKSHGGALGGRWCVSSQTRVEAKGAAEWDAPEWTLPKENAETTMANLSVLKHETAR